MHLLLGLLTLSHGATLVVDPGNPAAHAAVQDAIDAAANGDRIDVVAGTFIECLTVTGKALEVVGAGQDTTFLDTDGSCTNGIELSAGADVVFRDLHVTGLSTYSIVVVDSTASFFDVHTTGPATVLPPPYNALQTLFVDSSTVLVEDSELQGTNLVGDRARELVGVLSDSTVTLRRTSVHGTLSSYSHGIRASIGGQPVSNTTIVVEDSVFEDLGGTSLELRGATLVTSGNTFRTRDPGNIQLVDLEDPGSWTSTDDVFEGTGPPANSPSALGGAIISGLYDVSLLRPTFRDLWAAEAGAIWHAHGSFDLREGVFERVGSQGVKAAIYADEPSDFQLHDTVFRDIDGYSGTVSLSLPSGPVELSGLAFENGVAAGNAGAFDFFGCAQPAVISDVTISGSLATTSTGGVAVLWDCDATFTDLRVYDQAVVETGALFSVRDGSALTVERAEALRIAASLEGGVLHADGAGAITLRDSRFCDVSAAEGGLAWVRNATGPLVVENVRTVDVTALTFGGVFVLEGVPDATIRNNTFVGAGAFSGGVGWFADSGGDWFNNLLVATPSGTGLWAADATTATGLTVRYSNFWDVGPTHNGGSYGGFVGVEGNLSADPLFAAFSDDGNCDNDDFTPLPGSPVIDAGDPAVYDPDGSRSDIGASPDVGPTLPVDADDDGYPSNTDCDDSDPAVFPGAVEACNGVDDNCDGAVDEPGATGGVLVFLDDDGDGHGDPQISEIHCGAGDGWLLDDSDCDDSDPAVNPSAPEVPYNGLDDDCQGGDLVDVDADGDPATVAGGLDCDDNDPTVEGLDLDSDGDSTCSGDCDDNDPLLESLDSDGDGFSTCEDDCDDNDPGVSPGAPETAGDGVDQDCDGVDPPALPDDKEDTGDVRPPEPKEDGCGCSQGPGPLHGLWTLAALAVVRRRRQ